MFRFTEVFMHAFAIVSVLCTVTGLGRNRLNPGKKTFCGAMLGFEAPSPSPLPSPSLLTSLRCAPGVDTSAAGIAPHSFTPSPAIIVSLFTFLANSLRQSGKVKNGSLFVSIAIEFRIRCIERGDDGSSQAAACTSVCGGVFWDCQGQVLQQVRDKTKLQFERW